ncbi:MAG TPA: hypothetical protein VKU00_17505 [Chthonomonadaceae bacterium]|nr:hypothetical protein [Chthonomonadaceae bacterium]
MAITHGSIEEIRDKVTLGIPEGKVRSTLGEPWTYTEASNIANGVTTSHSRYVYRTLDGHLTIEVQNGHVTEIKTRTLTKHEKEEWDTLEHDLQVMQQHLAQEVEWLSRVDDAIEHMRYKGHHSHVIQTHPVGNLPPGWTAPRMHPELHKAAAKRGLHVHYVDANKVEGGSKQAVVFVVLSKNPIFTLDELRELMPHYVITPLEE